MQKLIQDISDKYKNGNKSVELIKCIFTMLLKMYIYCYSIVSIGNAESRDYNETIIYDFSNGRFPDTLDFLAANYTDNIVSQIPLGVTSSADFLIILGIDNAY